MANSKRKCIFCKTFKTVDYGIVCNFGFLCSSVCQNKYGMKDIPTLQQSLRDKKETEVKARHKVRKKELRTRSQWYSMLQVEVNRRVQTRDAGKPCCTCRTANPNIKYDAGHLFAIGRGGADRRRFNEFNIHRQCSVKCNQHGSGMRAEYEKFIVETYGQEKLDWLSDLSNFPTLKEQFPHWSDIEKEIIRYRKLNNER